MKKQIIKYIHSNINRDYPIKKEEVITPIVHTVEEPEEEEEIVVEETKETKKKNKQI